MEHEKTQNRPIHADRTAKSEPRAISDEVTFEPMPVRALDPATGLILESLRRREPTMIIR